MDEKEWNEIENSIKQKELADKEKYGCTFDELQDIAEKNKNEKKKHKILFNIFNSFLKLSKVTSVIITILIIFILYIFVEFIFSNAKNKFDIDAKYAVESMYNIKVKVLNKEIDDKNNGKYYMMSKKNNINFTAIKKYGNLADDYSAQCHKHYFELWAKLNTNNNFKVIESNQDGLLNYETYVDNFTNIDDATKEIINFVSYCGENFMPNWNLYILKENIKIFPYQNGNCSDEEAMNTARENYNRYFNNIENK